MRIVVAVFVTMVTAPAVAFACGGGGSGYSGGSVQNPDPFSECIRWEPADAGDSGATDAGGDGGEVCVERGAVPLGCSTAQGSGVPFSMLLVALGMLRLRRGAVEAAVARAASVSRTAR